MSAVVLLGLPGAGKSTTGRQLARYFSCAFIDCDQLIEAALGMHIKEYFAQQGEAVFRDKEAEILQQALSGSTFGHSAEDMWVLSTGGGVVLRPRNRSVLQAKSYAIYLYATPQALYQRLKHDTTRPLLQGGDTLFKLENLFQQRDALYRCCARHVLDVSNLTAIQTTQKIVTHLHNALAS